MGAKLFRESFGTQNQETKKETSLPKEWDFLSHKILDADFDKLYLNSREQLHALTENPSEEILRNFSQCFKQNSKFLSNCFNDAAAYQYDIVDLVTDRLTYHGDDYKVLNTESEKLGSYLRPGHNYDYKKQPHP